LFGGRAALPVNLIVFGSGSAQSRKDPGVSGRSEQAALCKTSWKKEWITKKQ